MQRAIVFVLFSFYCVLSSSVAFAASAWKPDQRIEMVVGVSAGAGSDITVREMHKLLTEKKLIDANASVVNKPGGGGTIALTYLSQQPGNGHIVMVTSPT